MLSLFVSAVYLFMNHSKHLTPQNAVRWITKKGASSGDSVTADITAGFPVVVGALSSDCTGLLFWMERERGPWQPWQPWDAKL